MKNLSFIIILFLPLFLQAQDYKFGKVSKAELEEKFYPLDSTANAAILYTKRKTNFEYSNIKGFYIVEKYFTRLKIYNKEGFDNATKKILTYYNISDKEKVTDIKAATYNLVDGKIVKNKLSKKNIYKEVENKYYNSVKFTLPNLKPGSVVEWEYTFKSPFTAMFNEVELQQEIPIKKIFVSITIPEYYVYNVKTKGYLPTPVKRDKKGRILSQNYQSGAVVNVGPDLSFDENIFTIEKTNVPAIVDEPYSGNLNNYKSGLLFELSYTKFPDSPVKPYAETWKDIVEKLYDHASFGGQLKKKNHFKNDLNLVLQGNLTLDEKIAAVFNFAKHKIKWNGYYGISSSDGIKKAYKEGAGNVADVNLSLVSMLRSVGIDAEPVLVSTINHGIPLFPTIDGFNYVIAKVTTPKGDILLDATEKNALPNILPNRVLNFHGLVVKKGGESEWINLFPNKHSILATNINAKFTEEGINGIARKIINNNFLFDYRNKARGKSNKELTEWIDKKISDVEVINARVSHLDDLYKDVSEFIKFETESYYDVIANKTYITPLLYTQMTENPFKSEKRNYPIFFNKPRVIASNVKISFPDNYTIESIPKSAEYVLPNKMGGFIYNIVSQGNLIQVNSKIIINTPVVFTDQYQNIKDFYKKIIDKENEKIILVKKE